MNEVEEPQLPNKSQANRWLLQDSSVRWLLREYIYRESAREVVYVKGVVRSSC